MKTQALFCVSILALIACAAPPETVIEADAPPPEKPMDRGEVEQSTMPDIPITPLEDIIESGDYNNDTLPETRVPGTGQVTRDIPRDPFLERVEQRDNAVDAD